MPAEFIFTMHDLRKSAGGKSFHHLMVHPDGLGRRAFAEMVARIERHLFGP